MTPTGYEAAAARAYAEGRREQRCPNCGREEAGGSHCTAGPKSTPPCDYHPMHPDQWTNDTATGRAARDRGRAMAARRATKSATGAEPIEPSHRPLAPPPTASGPPARRGRPAGRPAPPVRESTQHVNKEADR